MKALLVALALSVASFQAAAITPDGSKVAQYKVSGKVTRVKVMLAANRLFKFQIKPVASHAPTARFPDCHNVRFRHKGEVKRLQFNCSSKAKLIK